MVGSSDMEKMIVELRDFVHSKFFGKYPALVNSIDDPENVGCIKVKLEEVYGDRESPWALPCVPFAGKDHGLIALPEKGDGVWIEFARGDPRSPIWTGFWWAKDEKPLTRGAKTRSLITSAGHKIILDDDNNELILIHSNGAEIKATSDNITLKSQSAQIVLSGKKVNINNGALVVE